MYLYNNFRKKRNEKASSFYSETAPIDFDEHAEDPYKDLNYSTDKNLKFRELQRALRRRKNKRNIKAIINWKFVNQPFFKYGRFINLDYPY